MTNTNTKMIELQMNIEKLNQSLAASKSREQMEGFIKTNSEYNLSYGKKALKEILPIVEAYIYNLYTLKNQHTKKFFWDYVRPAHFEWMEDKSAKKADRKDLMNPTEKLADLICVNLIGSLSSEITLTSTAGKIARNAMFALNVPHDVRSDYNDSAIQFFGIIIQHVSENTALYNVNQIDNREYVLSVSEEWREIIEQARGDFGVNVQAYSPMIVKPLPHKDLISGTGGYLINTSPLMKRPVKEKGKVVEELVNFNAETNPEYFEVINRKQEIPYCVNTKLLEVLREYYNQGYSFSDFPVSVDEDKADLDSMNEVDLRNKNRAKWARDNNTEYTPLLPSTVNKIKKTHLRKEIEAARKTNALFEQADAYTIYDEFFYPIFVDHRNRRYPYCTSGLTYQGDEMAKALVQFANKKALTEDGVIALFETLGNTLGQDKKHINTKAAMAVAWWKENMDNFLAGDFSVFFDKQKDFDEPINALAIVLELIEIHKDPEYKSGYIAHRDARVSGSSIIGTILRDKNVMELTSVIDLDVEDLPDAYSEVAEKAMDEMVRLMNDGNKLAEEMHSFATNLFTRKIFKYVVMTYCSYGLTDYSIRLYNGSVFDWKEHLSMEHKKLFDTIMLTTLNTALPSCSQYLSVAREVGREVTKRDGKFSYFNPINKFPVVLHNFKIKERRIEVNTGMTRIQLSVKSVTDKLDVDAVVREVAPGIIHNLDATLLYMVDTFLPETETAQIHDSIGAHPNDVKDVVGAYGKAMYVYAKSDVFEKIFAQFGMNGRLAPVDTCSQTDLQQILQSKHILC